MRALVILIKSIQRLSLVLLIAVPLLCLSAKDRSPIKSYRLALENSDFSNALTTGTTLRRVCSVGGFELVLYDNIVPGNGHESRRIVIFHNGVYSHDYEADGAENCKFDLKVLVCRSYFDKGVSYKTQLTGILRGQVAAITGDVSPAWHGKRTRWDNSPGSLR